MGRAGLDNILVRDASDRDMLDVQRIYAHHVRTGLATFEEIVPRVAEMAERRAAVLASGLPWLAAEADGKVVGYAYAGFYHKREAYRYTIEDSIYVADGQRGRGVGRALLTALIARCEAGPWRQMIALIGDSENFGSIALHRRSGFQPIGVLPSVGFKLGRWVDVVLMQRALGPGDRTRPPAREPQEP